MARPIAPTPTLSGKDAERFVAKAKNPQPFTPQRRNNKETLEEIRQKLLASVQK